MPRETSQSGRRLARPPRPPAGAGLAEFVVALGLLREWAGLTIQALENKDRNALPHTTTGNYLRGKGSPRWEWLHAFVTVCLTHGGLTVGEIAIELDCWKTAWLRLRAHQINSATVGKTLVGSAEDAHQPAAHLPELADKKRQAHGQEQPEAPAPAASGFARRLRWTRHRAVAAAIAGALVAGGLVLVAVRPWSAVGVCGSTVEYEYASYAYRFSPCWAGGTTVVWFRDMEGDGYCVIGQVTFQHRTGFGTPKPLPPRACPARDEKGKRVELRTPVDSIGAEVSFALSADSTALLSPAPAAPTSAPACPLTVVPLPPSVNPGLRVVLFAQTGCPLWQAGYGCPADIGRDVWQLPTHVAQASHGYRLDFARHVCTVKIYDHADGTGTGCTLSAGRMRPLADGVNGRAFSVVVLRDPQEQKC